MQKSLAVLLLVSALLCSFVASYPENKECAPPPAGVKPTGPPPAGCRPPGGPPGGNRGGNGPPPSPPTNTTTSG